MLIRDDTSNKEISKILFEFYFTRIFNELNNLRARLNLRCYQLQTLYSHCNVTKRTTRTHLVLAEMSRRGRRVLMKFCGAGCSGRKELSMDTIRAVAMYHEHTRARELDLKCKIAYTYTCAHALMSDLMLTHSK